MATTEGEEVKKMHEVKYVGLIEQSNEKCRKKRVVGEGCLISDERVAPRGKGIFLHVSGETSTWRRQLWTASLEEDVNIFFGSDKDGED